MALHWPRVPANWPDEVLINRRRVQHRKDGKSQNSRRHRVLRRQEPDPIGELLPGKVRHARGSAAVLLVAVSDRRSRQLLLRGAHAPRSRDSASSAHRRISLSASRRSGYSPDTRRRPPRPPGRKSPTFSGRFPPRASITRTSRPSLPTSFGDGFGTHSRRSGNRASWLPCTSSSRRGLRFIPRASSTSCVPGAPRGLSKARSRHP